MLGRIVAAGLVFGGLVSGPASAQSGDAVAGAVAGAVIGAAIATAVVPQEHREPLRTHIYREPPPSYAYSDEVVVGREFPPGPYRSHPVPERYGVPGHHYAIVNNRAVVYHPESRRIIHVYD